MELEDADIVSNLNLRSHSITELIYRKPSFILRWALPIFLLLIAGISALSFYIKYPDVILAKAIIIANDMPKELITQKDGRIVKVFLKNKSIVREGDIVGFIESNGNHEQVLCLSRTLDTILNKVNGDSSIHDIYIDDRMNLGELQQGFQQFMTGLQEFKDYMDNGYYLNKKKVLLEDLNLLNKNNIILNEQKTLLEKDLKLAEETYSMNKKLFEEKVIAKQDDRNELSKLLLKRMNIPQIESGLLENEKAKRDKYKEITELDHLISQQKVIFKEQLRTFKNLVDEWIRKYVLICPTTGELNYVLPLQQNSYFPANKLLGYVSPANTNYYAEIFMPQSNFGKVVQGQSVQLRLEAYPYNEYGYVEGVLSTITDFAIDSGFVGRVQLPKGLLSNQKKILHYRNGLTAEGRVITNNVSLFDRLFYNLNKILNF